MKNLSVGLILLILTACSHFEKEVIVYKPVELPNILTELPPRPVEPQPPRTNLDMYYYHKELHRYADWLEIQIKMIEGFLSREEP